MAEAGVRYPSVFVVDKETLPPLPPKPGQMQAQYRRNRWIQNTLFLLVCIALCCIAVEACFIYKLYKTRSEPVTSNNTEEMQGPRTEARKGGPDKKNDGRKQQSWPLMMEPPRPMAHLAAGSKTPDKDGVMLWNDNNNLSIRELEYTEGKLLVQKEGYYYIYSKISFSPSNSFIHSVRNLTPRYQGKALELMRDRRYQPNSGALKSSMRSSYLGGIFYLNINDAIYVHVNNNSLVRLQSQDNFFGMYML